MNKLEGFFELQSLGIPTVPWRQFEQDTKLSKDILWTIRTAVAKGDDLNLPRKVGITAEEAEEFARSLLKNMGKEDLVIYYPYFIAQKSGVLEVSNSKVVIEAVKDDLWNLVTYNKLDVSIAFYGDTVKTMGNKDFLSEEEIQKISHYADNIKRKCRGLLLEYNSLFLEWSFACTSDKNKNPIDKASLLFYELRSVK